jgi:hypothetical protein
MIKRIILLLSFLGIYIFVTAQENIIVFGTVTDLETGKAIEDVHVKVNLRNIITTSNTNGNFQIRFPKKERISLVFSHTSYQTTYELIPIKNDTLKLNVKLKKKIENLPPFTFNDNGLPQIVFKSPKISIADYEFYEDKLLFLVYGKRLSKDSEIYLVDENENIISKHFVPGEPVELYSDYLGNINLICKTAIYRIGIENDKISIYELPLDEFNQLIKPIVDTLDGSIIFSDFLKQFPRFKYYAFNSKDTSAVIIKEMVHKDMAWKYDFEYHFLSNAEKQFAKRMAKRYQGYDKYDIAAQMTGFANDFLYEEVYAPLFIINDTINIFDHYEDKIWKFVDDTIQVDSIPFEYHKPRKKSEWKRELIMDEVNGKIYGVFLKNGYYYLKQIDNNSGEIILEKKLHYQFVDKLKIKDGFIYYTYKPRETLQKLFLYRERF